METWRFKGDWTESIYLPAFDFEGTNDSVPLNIVDLLNDDPDPLPAQVIAINFIIANQHLISSNILQFLYREYAELKNVYEDYIPAITDADSFRNYIQLTSLEVATTFKDKHAYVDFNFRCSWDEEHGLSISTLKDDAFHWGGIGDSKRLGEDDASKEIHQAHPHVPKFYSPHAKYGKLKPTQHSANKYFELTLIRGFHNEEFKKFIHENNRDVNYVDPDWGFWGTYVGWAIQGNNYELRDYLLSKGADLKGVLHNVSKDRVKIEWLISQGVSIDEHDRSGHTLLREVLFSLRSNLTNRETAKKYNHGYLENVTRGTEQDKDFARWLVSKGADPRNADLDSVMAFSGRDYDAKMLKKEILECLYNQ